MLRSRAKICNLNAMTGKMFATTLFKRVRVGGSRMRAADGVALSMSNEEDPKGSNRVEPREQALVPVA